MEERDLDVTSQLSSTFEANKVSSLRKQFESFGAFDKPTRPKPPPKPSVNHLVRTQTMRVSALLNNRLGLVVKDTRPMLTRSLSDERTSSDSSNEIYENVQINNNKSSTHTSDEPIYENVEWLRRNQTPKEEGNISNFKLLQKRLEKLKIGPPSPHFKPPPPPKPTEETSPIYDFPVVRKISHNKKRSSTFRELSDDSWDDDDVESTAKHNQKTRHIIQELLDTERAYIATLGQGIEDYLWIFDSIPLPDSLKGQKRNLFSNVEAIYEFHKTTFLPKLVGCDFDPERIANAFTSAINGYQFDIYIVYVLSRKKSQVLCQQNEYFFRQIQKDRLGINSFLLQPVQILPRYQMMVGELVKNLLKDLDNHKTAIAACCVAEKSIQRLLNSVDEQC